MIWLLSKAGRIEADKWTGKPSELAYYCHEGDPGWTPVTEDFRDKICKRKETEKPKKAAKRKTGGDLHDKAANWRHNND